MGKYCTWVQQKDYYRTFVWSFSVALELRPQPDYQFLDGLIQNGSHCPDHNYSCRGRCESPTELTRTRQQCRCDELCLHLGDCCYDYLHVCHEPHWPDLVGALLEQREIFHNYRQYSDCVELPMRNTEETATLWVSHHGPVSV